MPLSGDDLARSNAFNRNNGSKKQELARKLLKVPDLPNKRTPADEEDWNSDVLFEVKSFKEWPFYINGKNKVQYERYLELRELYGLEVIYALRVVGGKGDDKWRFAHLNDFSTTNRGNACIRYENTGGLSTMVSTMNG